MGREIRRVPPNWKHPKEINRYRHVEEYKPLFGGDYEDAAREWWDAAVKYDRGELPEYASPDTKEEYPFYWEYNGPPPNKEDYVPYKQKDATWYQMYETVTEGTPVTPPFETKAELVDYLVTYGSEWDDGPWNRANAERFVKSEYASSMIIDQEGIKMPKDQ